MVLAAVAVAWFAWFAPSPGSDPSALPAKSTVGRGDAAVIEQRPSRFGALPERAAIGEPRGELFGAQSWAPPQVSSAVAPKAAPAAPPNPYKVAGKVVQNGGARVFLVKGDRVIEARTGEELDGGYRIEAIAADHVVLVYVPLGTRESLPFSSVFTTEGAQAAVPATPPTAVQAPAPAAAAVAGAATAGAGPAKPAQLRWEGPQQVRAGSTFSVALHISSNQPLRATPMQLRYEPELLEPLNVRAGRFFGQGSFTYRTNTDGSIFVGAAGRGAAPGADAELIVLTFRSKKAGTTAQIKLSSLALQGAGGSAIAHEDISIFRTAIQ